jgi:hypothetical protein
MSGTRIALAALLLAACGHTTTTGTPQAARPEERRAASSSSSSASSGSSSSGSGSSSKEARPAAKRAHGTADTPVPRTPAAALEPGQLRNIQKKLSERHLLAGDHHSESIDQPTESALRRLQHEEKLPETGLPDHETVRKLGLDPDKVFTKRDAPSEQKR